MIKKILKTSLIISLAGLFVSFVNYIAIYYIALNETKESLSLFFKAISIPTSISGLISNVLGLFLPTLLIGLNVINGEGKKFFSLLGISIYLNIAISILLFILYIFNHDYTFIYSSISFLQGASLIYFSIEASKSNSSGQFTHTSLASILASLSGIALLLIFYKKVGLIALPASQTICFFIAGKLISQNIKVEKLSLNNNSRIYTNFFLASIALSGNSLWPIFDTFWTSLTHQNYLAVISIAQKLQIAFSGLIITGIYTVLGTHFQNKTIDQNLETIKKMIIFVLIVSFLLSFCILFLYLLSSNFIMRYVPNSLDGIVSVFFILQAGMAFMIISTLLIRFYCGIFKYFTAAKIGLFFCILYFGLCGILISEYGANGMAFSYSLSWFLTALLFGAPLFIPKKLQDV